MKLEAKALEKNPVFRTAKRAMALMKNKIFLSLFLVALGLSFLFSQSADQTGAVIMASIVLIVAALVNICFHLIPKERTKLDVFLAILNLIPIAAGVFCLISPGTVEPLVRYFFAVLTVVTNVMNLLDVLKLENKTSWRFYVGLIVSILMIFLGVIMFFAEDEDIVSMQQGVGLFLIINSLINLPYALRLHFAAKKAAKEAEKAEETAGREPGGPEEGENAAPPENR